MQEDPEVRPFPESLCHRCAARRYVQGRATVFILCTALPEKYPRQPVLRCPAHRPEGAPPEGAK
jgi:hypothetical protein